MRQNNQSSALLLRLTALVLLMLVAVGLPSCGPVVQETPQPPEPADGPIPPVIERTGAVEQSVISGISVEEQFAVGLDEYSQEVSFVPGQLLVSGTAADLDELFREEEFGDWPVLHVISGELTGIETRLLGLPAGLDPLAAREQIARKAAELGLANVQSSPNYLHAAPWDIGAEPWDIGAEPWDIGAEGARAGPGELMAGSCVDDGALGTLETAQASVPHMLPWKQWALLRDGENDPERQGIDLFDEETGERTLAGTTGEGVHVIILDTAPFERSGRYEISGLTQPLLVQFPSTVVAKDTSTPIPEPPEGNINEHGLFVAALIHYVAPDATLELVRVLNDDGVGDMATLQAVLNQIAGRGDLSDTVINMSLSLTMQQTLQAALGEAALQNVGAVPVVPEGTGVDAEELVALRQTLQALQEEGALIVAAAGNDSSLITPAEPVLGALNANTPTEVHLANVVARWPQSLGVAGHDIDAAASCFSNQFVPGQRVDTLQAQRPSPSPLVYAPAGDGGVREVPAGESAPLSCENRLPECPQACGASSYDCRHGITALTTRGYAYWAGTSFATPLVSGMVALVREGNSGSARDVQQCIIEHFNAEREFDVVRLLSACGTAAAVAPD